MENNITVKEIPAEKSRELYLFYKDVLRGLTSTPKYLEAKYFYDAAGDKLFQDIMECPEYYPTKSEMEIFSGQSAGIAEMVIADGDDFDLIELGAGDATKSEHLLKYLMEKQTNFKYVPIDISENIINYLNLTLPVSLPGLRINALNGEYFNMLKKSSANSDSRKVILFLGANIGNMSPEKAMEFCHELREHMSPGDIALIGIDLKKNPKTILAAYNDLGGITKRFNLNLLNRINQELGANFDVSRFEHFPTYDPATGTCTSYLVSLADQEVKLANQVLNFRKDEFIHMEISQKYAIDEIENMAAKAGFKQLASFKDEKNWFVDVGWIAS